MYDHLILDLDGTVYLDGVPIHNVVSVLNSLKNKGVKISVLTNNTSLGVKQYVEKIQRLGLPIDEENVFSPISVAGRVLSEKYGPFPGALILGTEGMIAQLENQFGFRQVEKDPQFVLIGFDKTLTYAKLQKACEWVNGGVPYYITHIDLACPSLSGPIPDCGALGEVVRLTTGIAPVDHFGKPGEWMASEIVSSLINKKTALLAGDRLYTDIKLGHLMGIDTLLVLSGESSAEMLVNCSGPRPTYVAETLVEFLECHYIIR